jgi:phosphoribosylaminoimidazole carboxylase
MLFLDADGPDSTAGQMVSSTRIVMGGLGDSGKIHELAFLGADVVTTEIEHINISALVELEAKGVNVQPSLRVLGIIQDKFFQKHHLASQSIPLPSFREVASIASIQDATRNWVSL